MCNLSENIEEIGIRKGITEGRKQGKRKERIDAIERMIKANAVREQILSYGYSEEEYEEAERAMYIHGQV